MSPIKITSEISEDSLCIGGPFHGKTVREVEQIDHNPYGYLAGFGGADYNYSPVVLVDRLGDQAALVELRVSLGQVKESLACFALGIPYGALPPQNGIPNGLLAEDADKYDGTNGHLFSLDHPYAAT